MEWQNGYQEPWGSPDPRASGPQGPITRGPEVPEDQGSVPMGILGALLGALVGAVPWFLVTTFANFYVGWLGFLVGWAAAFGYQKLKGRKSFGFAMVTVVICSLLALVAAEFGSIMYMLCTDKDLQSVAQFYGVSVTKLAFETLRVLLPEILEEILPNLVVGLLIGGLGILSAGKYVRQYTDPGMAAEMDQRVRAAQAARSPLAGFQSTGLELPRQFTVSFGQGRKALLIVLAVVEFLLIALLLMIGGLLGPWADAETLSGMLILCLIVGAVMVFAFIQTRRRIDVDGDYLLVKGNTFGAWDVANVSMSTFNGAIKLHGHDGRRLAQFNNNMKNAPLMMQWLREHNIPLRG